MKTREIKIRVPVPSLPSLQTVIGWVIWFGCIATARLLTESVPLWEFLVAAILIIGGHMALEKVHGYGRS